MIGHALYRQACKWRPVILGRVTNGVHEGVRHGTSATTTFVITEIIEEEDDIGKVTTGPEPFETCVGICMCGKEFEEGSGKVTLLLGGEDAKAVAPRPGFWKDSVVVGVGSGRERPDCLEVGEGEVHPWRNA